MKHLIIVESPAKARTIKSFLGKEYEVIASKGHVRDLPKSKFGIKIEDNKFEPEYRVARESSKIVSEIKEKAKNSDIVYIATDEDREGEAIGYHIAKAIGKEPEKLPRIVFHEITKNAILNALKNPRALDEHSFNAQQARRLLDRIVGYKLSPLLASKIQKGLSAGRVQSSSLKIVVDREREIKAFKPEEFWSLDAKFNEIIEAILVEFEGQKIDKMTIGLKDRAYYIYEILKDESYKVDSIEKKERTTSSPTPFMTSTLQQSASSMLGFSPKKTMMLAQRLYEGVKTHEGVQGVITYMRTDSLNVSKDAINAVRDLIGKEYGEKYLPKKPKYYKSSSKGAQEAHEAIRPTLLNFDLKLAEQFLEKDEFRLYKLIYTRFLASQMENAIFETQNILFKSKSGVFKASGRKLIFDGFYKVYGSGDKDKLLPELNEGDGATLSLLEANQHFTEPPARYSEASLIKKLESLGIGRPSTYAPTISILTARDYINIEKKQLIPTEVAFTVISLLEENFPNIVDSSFTSAMEESLDDIAQNSKDWQGVLREFYTPFIEQIEKGKKEIKSQKVAIPTGEECPECGSELVIRKGRFGEFVACSGFPKCKFSKNLTQKPKASPQTIDVPCPECGGGIVQRSSRRGKFFGCSNYPKCTFISTHEPTLEKCDKCGYMMAQRTFRGKEIFECIKCKNRSEK
ncbi:MAG: type I DNA topoisomerase [Campylobacterales bacterium]|nr:type I DNA topoisomerase [Campylobacterales bacterium]